ncbi:MAG: hypothetical protein MET45_14620 [Nostoc sp. LLA-1]|nr:hypothetical protein [Cyanocohniella sp. LLY]
MDNQEFEILPEILYIHKIDHRNNSPEKSQWTITEDDERNCFQFSLSSDWNKQPHSSWSLYLKNNTAQYIGNSAKKEPIFCQLFIAKFVDSNKNSKWHGYPANPSGQKPQDIPPEYVLNDWLQKEYLRRPLIRKIAKGQKCSL